ncbi:hypothetical protein ACLOJK_000662 [Asimina triloba]
MEDVNGIQIYHINRVGQEFSRDFKLLDHFLVLAVDANIRQLALPMTSQGKLITDMDSRLAVQRLQPEAVGLLNKKETACKSKVAHMDAPAQTPNVQELCNGCGARGRSHHEIKCGGLSKQFCQKSRMNESGFAGIYRLLTISNHSRRSTPNKKSFYSKSNHVCLDNSLAAGQTSKEKRIQASTPKVDRACTLSNRASEEVFQRSFDIETQALKILENPLPVELRAIQKNATLGLKPKQDGEGEGPRNRSFWNACPTSDMYGVSPIMSDVERRKIVAMGSSSRSLLLYRFNTKPGSLRHVSKWRTRYGSNQTKHELRAKLKMGRRAKGAEVRLELTEVRVASLEGSIADLIKARDVAFRVRDHVVGEVAAMDEAK